MEAAALAKRALAAAEAVAAQRQESLLRGLRAAAKTPRARLQPKRGRQSPPERARAQLSAEEGKRANEACLLIAKYDKRSPERQEAIQDYMEAFGVKYPTACRHVDKVSKGGIVHCAGRPSLMEPVRAEIIQALNNQKEHDPTDAWTIHRIRVELRLGYRKIHSKLLPKTSENRYVTDVLNRAAPKVLRKPDVTTPVRNEAQSSVMNLVSMFTTYVTAAENLAPELRFNAGDAPPLPPTSSWPAAPDSLPPPILAPTPLPPSSFPQTRPFWCTTARGSESRRFSSLLAQRTSSSSGRRRRSCLSGYS